MDLYIDATPQRIIDAIEAIVMSKMQWLKNNYTTEVAPADSEYNNIHYLGAEFGQAI